MTFSNAFMRSWLNAIAECTDGTSVRCEAFGMMRALIIHGDATDSENLRLIVDAADRRLKNIRAERASV